MLFKLYIFFTIQAEKFFHQRTIILFENTDERNNELHHVGNGNIRGIVRIQRYYFYPMTKKITITHEEYVGNTSSWILTTELRTRFHASSGHLLVYDFLLTFECTTIFSYILKLVCGKSERQRGTKKYIPTKTGLISCTLLKSL